MSSAGRSRIIIKKFSFSQQIEKLLWRLRRNTYESPVYHSEKTDCNWALGIELKSRPLFVPPFCDYIDFCLKREDFNKLNQIVKIHLIILDSFNLLSFYATKEIQFTRSCNNVLVLRINKRDLLYGCCGLNGMRFMPHDILTVKCEIIAYETVEENYANENELEDTSKYAKKNMCNWLTMSLRIAVYLISMVVVFCIHYYSGISIAVLLLRIFIIWIVLKILLYFLAPGGNKTYVSENKIINFIKKNIFSK